MITQEEKQLLLQVLSAMLPYGVKVLDNSHKNYGVSNLINIGLDGSMLIDNEINDIQYYPIIDETKPYLRPMSSMTEEERKYFQKVAFPYDFIDALNKHHFDYRGLIGKDLAIAVTRENNPYK